MFVQSLQSRRSDEAVFYTASGRRVEPDCGIGFDSHINPSSLGGWKYKLSG